jgi:hypothetical protein
LIAVVTRTAESQTITYTRPPLAAYQLDALFCPERYAVIEATSKAGKTVGAMAWLLEFALEHGGQNKNFWWVGPVYAQAKIAFRRIKYGLPPQLYTANEGELTLTLFNGAVIWFKGGDNPDSLYGEDVYAAVIDEATRCKEESWYAVRSTLTATRGPLRIIGNVKGRRNWAYMLARMAESGEPDMHYAKITAMDAVAAGILDAAEVEDAKRKLPDAVFRELYMAEPSDDGGNPFGLGAIAKCIEAEHGCEPREWGWDLAKSVDWTWGIGLCEHGAVCRSIRFQKPWQETIDTIVRYGTAHRAIVDSTGVGDPVLEALQRHPECRGQYEGFKFSAPSKQQLMEGLAVAIQQGNVKFPDGPLRAELEAFEFVYSRTGVHYSAPVGLHDDGVCALALAWSVHNQGGVSVWDL